MRRSLSTLLSAALVGASGTALAQGGDLSGVTMRVLDDVSDINAVIIELDAGRSTGEEGAESDSRRARGEANDAERETPQSPAADAEKTRRDERRDADALHDAGDDERSEGKLEDNDVERPAAAPTP